MDLFVRRFYFFVLRVSVGGMCSEAPSARNSPRRDLRRGPDLLVRGAPPTRPSEHRAENSKHLDLKHVWALRPCGIDAARRAASIPHGFDNGRSDPTKLWLF